MTSEKVLKSRDAEPSRKSRACLSVFMYLQFQTGSRYLFLLYYHVYVKCCIYIYVSHIDVSSELGVLIVGEDVWERGLKVTSLVINHNLLAGQRRLLLFEMVPRPIRCRVFERVGPLVHALGHYVRHTHRYSKWDTCLSCICSRHCVGGAGGRTLRAHILPLLVQYPRQLGNSISDGCTVLGIPKGYYNVCELDKEAFRPLGAELSLHAPTGRLQLSVKKRLVLSGGLAELLGFSRETFEPGRSHIADEPHPLITHQEICVHLAEVSTLENLHNRRPSTLLKSIPVENERCWGGRTETFPVLQYKRLASGPLSQLTLTILDTGGRKLGFDYLSAALHIRRNG